MIKANKLIFVLFALLAFMPLHAQDEAKEEDKDNLVPNGSFEDYEGSLRRDEQFDLVRDWGNATDVISDLYTSEIRSRYVKVPDNLYGEQEAADGGGYAGIVAYSYRSKRPRTYITVELKSKLKENTLYCVRYKASLAERSLYASNNLGVLLSKKRVSEKGTMSIDRREALLSEQNDIVTETDGWWTFCKRYAASGDEKYLTIGNFSSDANTSNQSRTVDSKYEKGPAVAAYYYIDDVEVRSIAANEDCGCSNMQIPESKVIYSGTPQLSDDMTMTEKVEAVDAYFYQYQSDVTASAKRNIDEIVAMMKSSPAMKVQVIGHMDNEEAELAKSNSKLKDLSEERARKVREYMASQGVDRTKILMDDKQNSDPVSKMGTSISLAKNRRVEFKIVF